MFRERIALQGEEHGTIVFLRCCEITEI